MKQFLCVLLAIAGLAFGSHAAVPSAEKLLPNDTLFFATMPDAQKLCAEFSTSASGRLWRDPAMKPFRDNFVKKFSTDVIEPLQKELGFKFADYKGMAQGQITFALVQNGWEGKPGQEMATLLLVDTKDKKDALQENLAALKRKWVDAGKKLRTEKIRDTEFTVVLTSDQEMGNSWKQIWRDVDRSDEENESEEKEPKKVEIFIGQADSLLVLGTSGTAIEKVLTRLGGGLIPVIAEDSVYESNHNALFRDAGMFAWLNLRPLLAAMREQPKAGAQQNPLAPDTQKILAASGLNSLTSLAFSYAERNDGTMMRVLLGMPEGSRQGLFKSLVFERKDSNPPPFVPADAVKFSRIRLDLQKTWAGIEAMLTEMLPQASGAFKLIFDFAGKDQDPTFDLRRELIGNLGDDIVGYEKGPRASTLGDLNSPPSLTLLGSANAEKLAHALKIALSSLGPASNFKEREFLGRKIYSLNQPQIGMSDPGQQRTLNFAASGGYVGISTDVALLEEFLRSNEAKAKPLSETAGLAEAAEKVGGMAGGLFGFSNHRETTRAALDIVKKTSGAFSDALGSTPDRVAQHPKLNEWADISLLPPFDAIAKYFHFMVYGGSFTANGLAIDIFSPTPPELRN